MRHKIFQICWLLLFLSISFQTHKWRILFPLHLSIFLCVARFSPVLLLFVEWTDCSSRVFCFPNQNVDKQMERKAETKTLRHTGKKAMLIIFAFCFLVMFSPFFFLNTKWVTVFHSRQIPLHTAKFLTANAPKCYYNKKPTSKLQFIKHERCNSDEMVISICR